MGKNRWGDGTLEINPEDVTLVFAGLIAQSVKRRASPRQIPFTAIADIEVAKPKKSGWGYLHLILAGTDPAEKFRPEYDLNTVRVLKAAHHAEAAEVAERLRGLIAGPAAVPHPDLLQQAGYMEYAEPDTDTQGAQSPAAKPSNSERLIEAAGAGGARPDIAEAAGRMKWTFGGKREIRSLHQYVNDNETVVFIAQGTYKDRQGIVVLTSERLLFVHDGWMTQQLEDFPLGRITAVATKIGLSTGDLTVRTGGAGEIIKSIINADLLALADRLRTRIGGGDRQSQAPASPQNYLATQPANDLLEQIRRLGELHEAGVLTSAEFNAKKMELLQRL